MAAESDHGGYKRSPRRVGVDVPNQADVELDDVRLQSEHVTEAGEAGAHVIDRQPHALQPRRLERQAYAAVVVDARVLRKLHDQSRER